MKIITKEPEEEMMAAQSDSGELRYFMRQIKHWYVMNIKRRIPHLVWYGQDVDVTVTFFDTRLDPSSTPGSIKYAGDMAALAKAEDALQKMGITFDKGIGLGGRDWEWDWSLEGNIRLSFRQKHKGSRARPKPELVEDGE